MICTRIAGLGATGFGPHNLGTLAYTFNWRGKPRIRRTLDIDVAIAR